MLRRLLLGLVEGLLIGLAFGVAVSRGLGLTAPSGLVAALFGAGTGFVVGLIAGRPIWSRHAKTEAFLKAAAGALGGIGLSFAFRRWLAFPLDLSAFSLGKGAFGELPAAALPAIATLLALFFEADDDGARPNTKSIADARAKRRLATSNSSAEASDDLEGFADDDKVARKHEKR